MGQTMGFGGATAWLFAREGAKVIVTDLNEEMGAETASQIRESGCDAIFTRLDVTDEQDWVSGVQAAVSNFGRLDVLVNNAGIGGGETVEETSVETWDRHMDVHAKGVFLGTKHAAPEMRRGGGGSVVNISSMYGIVGSGSLVAYHAAKGASRIFTKAAALQLAKDGIRVNSVHPGHVLTPMTAARLSDSRRRRALQAKIPMRRLGTPDEIASGILFLASDESSYMTGAELVIDGGYTAQ